MFKRGIITFAGIIILWELVVVSFQLPDYLLPGPFKVLKVILNSYQELLSQAMSTIKETLIGLVIGIVLGVSIALSMILFNFMRYWMMPILILSQAIPTFIFAPILVIWLGYGISSKIAITVFALFFPIASSFFDGLERTRQGWLDLAYTMGGNKWRTAWFIRIPAALPDLASGIRVATAWAPMAAVVGEWVGASKGLGYLMLNANSRLDIGLMFAALITLIVFSLTLYFIVDQTLKYLITWNKET